MWEWVGEKETNTDRFVINETTVNFIFYTVSVWR